MMTPSDYANLLATCKVTEDPNKLKELDYLTKVALANKALYWGVQNGVKSAYGRAIPWALVAAIHLRESDQDFTKHLHNGDPLQARTIHVPAGRPKEGQPPFTWIESAIDAVEGRWLPRCWDLPSCLEFLERWNGLGYQKHSVNSPYLWDYTDKYVSGLYVADGKFDPGKKESRPGCVAFLKTLEAKGVSLADFISLGENGPVVH